MGKSRRKRRQQKIILAIVLFIVILLILGVLGFVGKMLYDHYGPTKERMPLEQFFDIESADEVAMILDGEYLSKEDSPYAIYANGEVYITLDFVKKNLDDRYYFDYNDQLLRYTTTECNNTVLLGEVTYTAGDEIVSLGYEPIKLKDDKAYVALDFVEIFTDIESEVFDEPHRVSINRAGLARESFTVNKNTAIRRRGGNQSPILADVEKGELLYLIEDYGEWSFVCTEKGEMGCIQNRRMDRAGTVTTASHIAPMQITHNLLPIDISMMWYNTISEAGNIYIFDYLKEMSNINVLSPTWFALSDDFGGVSDIAGDDAVQACHDKGIYVWGLFSNFENPDVDTSAVLDSTTNRQRMIDNVVSMAKAHNLDGINVDFEQVPMSSSEGYIQFIREISIECKKAGLILSVDNYVPTAYTAYYNRQEQGRYADYIVIMAYDEHTSGSEEMGSNASIGFVSEGIDNTLLVVAPNQVVVGMPLYGRVWWKDDSDRLKNEAVPMEVMSNLKDAYSDSVKWLADEGQYYLSYTKDGFEKHLWVEDSESLRQKFEAVVDADVAGAAYWALNHADGTIYELAGEYLKTN